MEFSTFDGEFDNCTVPSIDRLFGNDSQLRNYEKSIRRRYGMFEKMKNLIESREGMDRFTKGYENYGVVVGPNGGVRCQEWVPNARALYLQGEFNNFERLAYKPRDSGLWELFIPPQAEGSCSIRHMTELKLIIETKDNQTLERISPWAKYVVPRSSDQGLKWLFWNPGSHQVCQKQKLSLPRSDRLRIYEAHVGIASNRCELSHYQNFTRNVLPRIRDMGYNCVLLMAIMEHPQHPSMMGCQVPSFYSTSSRFGTPEDLKELIKSAHSMGLMVMMDVMHNQASRMMKRGLNMFDENERWNCYGGGRDYYNDGNKINFDFAKWEMLRFLMSNLRYYMEEYCFDGFRFNGVPSMLYQGSMNHRQFELKNEDYFGPNVDLQSMIYLMLANDMVHRFNPNAVTIAEDYLEIPTLCRPVYEGGFGFDYRATTHISELWQKLLKERRDEEWDLDYLFRTMTRRRKGEKYIAFTENHDQSLPGRMTISRYLMKREEMSETSPRSLELDRGLSLHKMIRLITHTLAGEGYMNFMGNEFGNPDWVEFPSHSNNNNMQKARILFQLADDDNLRYKYLSRFDAAMNKAEEKYGWLKSEPAFVSRKHDGDKVFVFERAGLLFLFNFHPTRSYSDYRVGVENAGRYEVILDSDSKFYGGHGRNQTCMNFNSMSTGFDGRSRSIVTNIPSRSALVMANRDFFQADGYRCNRGVCQEYPNSSYQQPSRITGSSHSYSSSCDGNRGVMEENRRKHVSFHGQRPIGCQRHGCGCRGSGYSEYQCFTKPGEAGHHGCEYKKEEYTCCKHESGAYQEGRYW